MSTLNCSTALNVLEPEHGHATDSNLSQRLQLVVPLCRQRQLT